MSIKKQAISGVFWSTLQQLSGQLISFVVSMILARLLLPSEFGLIAMLGVFMSISSSLISSGLTNSLIRSDNLEEDDFSTVFYFNLVASIIIYIILFLAAPLIAIFYKQELLTLILRVYAINFVINAFSAIQSTRLTKILDFKTQMKVSIPSLIIGSFIGVTMAYLGFGVWSLVCSSIAQTAAATIQLWYWSKWKPILVFNIDKFKYHFKFGSKLMFSGIIDTIFSNSYTIIIGKYFAPAQVGFYNRADTLRMLPVNTISSILTKVTYPLFSSVQNDRTRLKKIYKDIMQMVVFIVSPILILMAVLAEPLFRFLFTEKWLPAVPYFQILCLNGIMYPIHAYNLQILNVLGHSDLFLKLEIIKKIIVVLVLIVSFQYGIYGLLYGGIFTSVIGFFINSHYSGKFLNYTAWQQTKDLLPIIGIATFVGTLVYFLDNLMIEHQYNDFIRLLFGGALYIGTYLVVSFMLKMNSLTELKIIILRK